MTEVHMTQCKLWDLPTVVTSDIKMQIQKARACVIATKVSLFLTPELFWIVRPVYAL